MKTTPRRHIRMIVYNIVSAGGNNLNAALWAMNHMHIDLGFLLETKLFHDKYTKNCEGYTVYELYPEVLEVYEPLWRPRAGAIRPGPPLVKSPTVYPDCLHPLQTGVLQGCYRHRAAQAERGHLDCREFSQARGKEARALRIAGFPHHYRTHVKRASPKSKLINHIQNPKSQYRHSLISGSP